MLSKTFLFLFTALLSAQSPAFAQWSNAAESLADASGRETFSPLPGTPYISDPVLFPDNVKGRFVLKPGNHDWDKGHTYLEVFSGGGKLLHEQKLLPEVVRFDLSSFKKGTYFLKLYRSEE